MEEIALVLKGNGILLFGLPNTSNKVKVFGLIGDHHGKKRKKYIDWEGHLRWIDLRLLTT